MLAVWLAVESGEVTADVSAGILAASLAVETVEVAADVLARTLAVSLAVESADTQWRHKQSRSQRSSRDKPTRR